MLDRRTEVLTPGGLKGRQACVQGPGDLTQDSWTQVLTPVGCGRRQAWNRRVLDPGILDLVRS